jgi:hypothetical protein
VIIPNEVARKSMMMMEKGIKKKEPMRKNVTRFVAANTRLPLKTVPKTLRASPVLVYLMIPAYDLAITKLMDRISIM